MIVLGTEHLLLGLVREDGGVRRSNGHSVDNPMKPDIGKEPCLAG